MLDMETLEKWNKHFSIISIYLHFQFQENIFVFLPKEKLYKARDRNKLLREKI